MNRNTKQILIILAAAVVFCIVGGAAALGGAGLIFNQFQDNVSSDPEKVRQMANGFMNYQLPDGYSEQMGMDFIIYKMVLISSSLDDIGNKPVVKPIIFVAHFESDELSAEQMTEQMQKSVEQQSGSSGLKLKVVDTRDVTINGNEAVLTVSEGSTAGGTAVRQWVSAFPGKTGFIIVMIQGPIESWDDAIFDEFLASISF
jgi:hypothetical protein